MNTVMDDFIEWADGLGIKVSIDHDELCIASPLDDRSFVCKDALIAEAGDHTVSDTDFIDDFYQVIIDYLQDTADDVTEDTDSYGYSDEINWFFLSMFSHAVTVRLDGINDGDTSASAQVDAELRTYVVLMSGVNGELKDLANSMRDIMIQKLRN